MALDSLRCGLDQLAVSEPLVDAHESEWGGVEFQVVSRARARILSIALPLPSVSFDYEYRPLGRTEYDLVEGALFAGWRGVFCGDLPPHPLPCFTEARGGLRIYLVCKSAKPQPAAGPLPDASGY